MKKILSSLVLMLLFISASFGQDYEEKGIRILKLDAYNLVGIGLQQLHIGYEVTPFEVNHLALPTIQFDVYVPMSTSDGTINIKPSVEAGIQLRFYRGNDLSQTNPSSFFLGAGLDGGFMQFRRKQGYLTYDPITNRDSKIYRNTDYSRVRVGIYGMIGVQSRLGERMFFDMSFGMGWNNITVKHQSAIPANYTINDDHLELGLFDRAFKTGKYPAVYVPLNMSIGFLL